MGTYSYRPLLSDSSIRVLLLYSGSDDESLEGEVRHIDDYYATEYHSDYDIQRFRDELVDVQDFIQNGYPFEALSYVWGPTTPVGTLATSEGAIPLTLSLTLALRHLRREDRVRCLWVDAICINQVDLVERGHQVKLMGQIYSNATQVLVWLGPDQTDSASDSFGFVFRASQRSIPMDSVSTREALWELAQSEWFSRLWVVQELLLSRSAIFNWGHERIDFDYLKTPLQRVFESQNYGFARWAALKAQPRIRFLQVMSATRGLYCTDERDRIYAMLGLSYDSQCYLSSSIARIEPDYTKRPGKLFFEVACKCVDRYEVNQLLSLVCHSHEFEKHGSPSWIPDWSARVEYQPLPATKKKNTKPWDVETDYSATWCRPDRSLLIYGSLHGDSVRYAGDVLYAGSLASTRDRIVNFWRDYILPQSAKMTQASYALYETRFLDILFCQTGNEYAVTWLKRLADMFSHSSPPSLQMSERWHAFQSSLQTSDRMTDFSNGYLTSNPAKAVTLKHMEEIEEEKTFHVADGIEKYWQERALISTNEGEFGLGPKAAKPGDILCDLWGGSHSVILRPQGDHYLFVGEALMRLPPKRWETRFRTPTKIKLR